jgi:putative PEP-CTERM system histidine kinase
MHDLKNIVAQQELVVSNSQRFRDKPEFIDDAFATIRAGVERMKRVLGQLRQAANDSVAGRVDVTKVLLEVRSQCADRKPIPHVHVNGQAAWARIDRDKLTSVLLHLVRNAQDATPQNGSVNLGVENGAGEIVITVADTGCGMDDEFIRTRLFRPFDTTKGPKGMGVGAYQARHIVRAAGGDVKVTSKQGLGTMFRLSIPAAEV